MRNTGGGIAPRHAGTVGSLLGLAGSGPQIGSRLAGHWHALAPRDLQLPGLEVAVKSWDFFIFYFWGFEGFSGTGPKRGYISWKEKKATSPSPTADADNGPGDEDGHAPAAASKLGAVTL